MALTSFGFESGADGDTSTTGNTGATGVSATGGTQTISTTVANSGTRSLKGIATSTSGTVYAFFTITSATSLYVEMWVYLTGSPNSETAILYVGAGATRELSLGLSTTRTLLLRDGANTSQFTTSALPLNTWCKVLLFATQNASTGTMRLAWSQTAPYATFDSDSTLLTGKNTGAAAYTQIRAGAKVTTGTSTLSAFYVDDFGYDPAATGFPIPVTTGTGTETVTVGESATGLTVTIGSATELATVAESTTATTVAGSSATGDEPFTVAESAAALTISTGTAPETVTVTETATGLTTTLGTAIEPITVTETAAVFTVTTGAADEPVTLLEAAEAVTVFSVTLVETITLAESMAIAHDLDLTISIGNPRGTAGMFVGAPQISADVVGSPRTTTPVTIGRGV